jgi:hypothetical protein
MLSVNNKIPSSKATAKRCDEIDNIPEGDVTRTRRLGSQEVPLSRSVELHVRAGL